jgi:hypothetical protein
MFNVDIAIFANTTASAPSIPSACDAKTPPTKVSNSVEKFPVKSVE